MLMTPPLFHVVLFQPEIPGNTGNVIRLCANTGSALHLIEPLGFEPDDARMRRAGLDYHEYAEMRRHPALDSCLASIGSSRVFAFSARASTSFAEPDYQRGDVLLFGPESQGLPAEALNGIPDGRCLRLPMRESSRSLNLSNAVAVAVFEGWRQLAYQ